MSNETFFTKLFDIEKTPVRFYFAIASVSGSIIYFKPDAIVSGKLYQEWESVIWVIFYLFTALFCTAILFAIPSKVFGWLTNKITVRNTNRRLYKILYSLDEYEQSILREFYLFNVSSVRMPYNDATVSGLVDKKILTPPGVYGSNYAHYYLRKKIRDLINDDHLGFPIVNSEEEAQREWNNLLEKRPNWAERLNNY